MILCGCTSQTINEKEAAKNELIKKYLDLVEDDSTSYSKGIQYNNIAYSLIDLNKNDALTRFYLYSVSYKYSFFAKNNALKSTAEKLMILSLKCKDSLNIGRANRNLGLYYTAISDNETAILYFFKAKKIFQSLKRMDYVIKVMNNISITQYYACDFLGSNKTSVEMISLAKKVNFSIMNNLALVNIGNNLTALKNDVEAINYYKKAQKITIKNNQNGIFNSIAYCYINLRQYDSALKYVNKNLNKELFSLDPTCYSRSISLSALIQLKKGQNYNLEKKLNLADNYFTRFNSEYGRNYNQIFLSMYYEKNNDNSNAIKAANRAFLLSNSYNNPSDILASLEQLVKVDKRNASKNAQHYIRINDSMQLAERRFRDKFTRIEYETNEVLKEKETAIEQKWLVGSISAIIILIIVLVLVITWQRSKQRELKFLQDQQQANEEIYDLMLTQKSKEEEARQSEKNRIAIELHDGVMNRLSSTRLNLNILAQKNDAQTIEKCLIHIEGIYQIEQEIRHIAHDLNIAVFNGGNGFISMLCDFVSGQNSIMNTHYTLEVDKVIDWNEISGSIKMNLYRIIQEASHNINKFAKAKNAMITLILDDNNLCLSITDNGQGFDVEAKGDGIGLKNIKLRVESLKGKLVIQSINRKSTSLNIAIPIA
jgi:signal transduction histidine kinase